jgi:hypothetical protein
MNSGCLQGISDARAEKERLERESLKETREMRRIISSAASKMRMCARRLKKKEKELKNTGDFFFARDALHEIILLVSYLEMDKLSSLSSEKL